MYECSFAVEHDWKKYFFHEAYFLKYQDAEIYVFWFPKLILAQILKGIFMLNLHLFQGVLGPLPLWNLLPEVAIFILACESLCITVPIKLKLQFSSTDR